MHYLTTIIIGTYIILGIWYLNYYYYDIFNIIFSVVCNKLLNKCFQTYDTLLIHVTLYNLYLGNWQTNYLKLLLFKIF